MLTRKGRPALPLPTSYQPKQKMEAGILAVTVQFGHRRPGQRCRHQRFSQQMWSLPGLNVEPHVEPLRSCRSGVAAHKPPRPLVHLSQISGPVCQHHHFRYARCPHMVTTIPAPPPSTETFNQTVSPTFWSGPSSRSALPRICIGAGRCGRPFRQRLSSPVMSASAATVSPTMCASITKEAALATVAGVAGAWCLIHHSRP